MITTPSGSPQPVVAWPGGALPNTSRRSRSRPLVTARGSLFLSPQIRAESQFLRRNETSGLGARPQCLTVPAARPDDLTSGQSIASFEFGRAEFKRAQPCRAGCWNLSGQSTRHRSDNRASPNRSNRGARHRPRGAPVGKAGAPR